MWDTNHFWRGERHLVVVVSSRRCRRRCRRRRREMTNSEAALISRPQIVSSAAIAVRRCRAPPRADGGAGGDDRWYRPLIDPAASDTAAAADAAATAVDSIVASRITNDESVPLLGRRRCRRQRGGTSSIVSRWCRCRRAILPLSVLVGTSEWGLGVWGNFCNSSGIDSSMMCCKNILCFV